MTDREDKEHVIKVLEKLEEDIFISLTKCGTYYDAELVDAKNAIKYAISSIKTDLKYDLLYEGKDILLTFSEGTLKYSNKDYVVYKKDWLKEHFDDERNIVCGEQGSAAENDYKILKAHSDGAREALDNVIAEIQKLRGCSCSCSDGIIDDIEDIIDKYREVE